MTKLPIASRRTFLACAAALPLAGCDLFSQRQEAGEAQLFLNWIFSGSFAGDAIAARETAPARGLQLTLRQGGQGLDPLRLVSDGNFGAAAFDEILSANERGADLVILGAINQQTPACFAALRSSGITTPQDFVGRRVGVLPFGSTRLVYQALLRANDIDPASITEVVVSPDLRPFITGRTHDVQPVFVFDEPVTLDAQGVEYSLVMPSDFGVRFVGPCYFTTRATLRDQRELCDAFVGAMKAGWRQAVEQPEAAIAALATFDGSIDRERELAVLQRGAPFFASDERAPLSLEDSVYQETVSRLLELQVIRERPADVVAFDLANAD